MPEKSGKRHRCDIGDNRRHPPKKIDPAELKLLFFELTGCVPDEVRDRNGNDDGDQRPNERCPLFGRIRILDVLWCGVQGRFFEEEN